MQIAHVVLLEPAARVGRVPVRRPVQVGADILAGPRPQQLLAPRVVPHEASEVVEAGPAADPAVAGRQAPLDLGGREGGGGGRSGGHGGRAELAAGSPGFCSAAAQPASNIPGAAAALTGRPPPHLLICMRRSHWPLGRTPLEPGGALFPIGRQEAEATVRVGPQVAGPPPGGPGQVEGAPARCGLSQESEGDWRMRAEQLFPSRVAVWTDILGGVIAPGSTLLLLPFGRNWHFSILRLPEGARGGGGLE